MSLESDTKRRPNKPKSCSDIDVNFDVFLTEYQDLEEEEDTLADFMSVTPDLDFHVPCFPTPPYEGPDDSWMAEFGGDASPMRSPDSSLGGDSLEDLPVLSEFDCVRFSDVLLPGSDPALNQHASFGPRSVPPIEDAPAFDNIEVGDLLENLKDLDLPGFPAPKDEMPTMEPISSTSAIIKDETAKDESIGEVAEGTILKEFSNASDTKDLTSDQDTSELGNYKKKLRRSSRRLNAPSSSTAGEMSNESEMVKIGKPVLQMVKVSQFDQYRKRGDETIKMKINNSALSTLEDEVEFEVDKSRKAAIQAKINREKKKAYTRSLEVERDTLQAENESLRRNFGKLEKSHKSLTQEVAYLKNVLQNQSALAGLLKNIGNTQGVTLSSSFVTGKRKGNSSSASEGSSEVGDHDYGKRQRLYTASRGKSGPSESQNKAMTGGICLHVQDNENVSLEFCSSCAKRAKGSLQ